MNKKLIDQAMQVLRKLEPFNGITIVVNGGKVVASFGNSFGRDMVIHEVNTMGESQTTDTRALLENERIKLKQQQHEN